MTFELQYNDTKSNARAGLITTDHGVIETPIFMPVGTQGTVKGVHMTELKEDTKAQIILGNTYHLYLRPGIQILEQAGGLHKFNTWDRPILTDSGGFQVFSLSDNRKLHEEGAEFRSHLDGSKHMFTPEKVMDIERSIGADIIMAFDECCPGDADYNYAKQSLGLTERWLDRCFARFNSTEPKYGYRQSLFPIVQGCVYTDLRQRAAENVARKGADGNAIGGLSGAFIPVSEDAGMIDAVNAGSLSLEKLEAMTCVCSVGLDMIVIPGDTSASTISAIIADEAAIGMVNHKTTAVRVIPAIGKKEGEVLEFGGLLGHGPIMKVSPFSSEKFIERGGRIPAPLQSLKN